MFDGRCFTCENVDTYFFNQNPLCPIYTGKSVFNIKELSAKHSIRLTYSCCKGFFIRIWMFLVAPKQMQDLERCSIFRSSCSEVFCKEGALKNFTKFTGKHLCLRPGTLLKKRLWHRCFPVNIVKLLRSPFLQNSSGRFLLCILCRVHYKLLYYKYFIL